MELLQDFGEEVEELLEALHVLDHSHDLEEQLVHSLGKLLAEGALVVFQLQGDLRLLLDEPPDLGASRRAIGPCTRHCPG